MHAAYSSRSTFASCSRRNFLLSSNSSLLALSDGCTPDKSLSIYPIARLYEAQRRSHVPSKNSFRPSTSGSLRFSSKRRVKMASLLFSKDESVGLCLPWGCDKSGYALSDSYFLRSISRCIFGISRSISETDIRVHSNKRPTKPIACTVSLIACSKLFPRTLSLLTLPSMINTAS